MFDGVDIQDVGLEYAPESKQTQVYNPSEWKNNEQSFDSHNGGYFFGATVEPKTFVLRCFYDNRHVLSGLMTGIHTVFRRGKTGRLVFKNRPWVWYTATVVDVDASNMLNARNGLVTITLRAYYPFARCDNMYIDENEYDDIMLDKIENSALMIGYEWNNYYILADEENRLNTSETFYVPNPGTERAPVSVCIAGDVGSSVTIANGTTRQACEIVGLTSEITEDDGKYLKCDALTGQTSLVGLTSERAFLYHKEGFIELEPSYPIIRDVHFTFTAGSNIVVCDIYDASNLIGQRLQTNRKEFEANIVGVEGDYLITIDKNAPSDMAYDGCIMPVNKIQVTGDANMNLGMLELRFNPTFS